MKPCDPIEFKPFDPYDHFDCMHQFIEDNYQDFEMHCMEKNIHHDFYCDEEVNYCELNDEKFREFGEKWVLSIHEEEADRMNDEAKLDNMD